MLPNLLDFVPKHLMYTKSPPVSAHLTTRTLIDHIFWSLYKFPTFSRPPYTLSRRPYRPKTEPIKNLTEPLHNLQLTAYVKDALKEYV